MSSKRRPCHTCNKPLPASADPNRKHCEPCAAELKRIRNLEYKRRLAAEKAAGHATVCTHCKGSIPVGRRSSVTKFCSRTCNQAARRARLIKAGVCSSCGGEKEVSSKRLCGACSAKQQVHVVRSRKRTPPAKRRRRVLARPEPVGVNAGLEAIASPRARWRTHTREEIEGWISVRPTEPRLAGLGYWGSIAKMFEAMPDMRELMPGLYQDFLEHGPRRGAE